MSEATHPAKTLEERKAILAQSVSHFVTTGRARIESQTDTMAVLVRGHRTNHLLHFFISLFTVGLWLPVWLLLTAFGGEKREVRTVDEYGNIRSQKG